MSWALKPRSLLLTIILVNLSRGQRLKGEVVAATFGAGYS